MSINLLRAQLDEIAALATKDPEVLNRSAPRVSKWGVSEHLDHLTRVLRAVFAMILNGPEKPGGKMNLIGRVVLFTGFIPRGRGKSPDAVRGKPATKDEILHAVEKCRKLLAEIDARAEAPLLPVFPHPFFGQLTRTQALRFLVVHNRHHFKIVRDVIAAPL
jgi:hypothetical protein